MQIRELSASELEEGYLLLSSLRPDLTPDQFEIFIASQYPKDYRPIGAYERGELRIYAGVSIRENLEIGRYLMIDDFIAREGYEHLSGEMIDFLGDYAKIHACKTVLIWGKQQGLNLNDLKGFHPKRDGFVKSI